MDSKARIYEEGVNVFIDPETDPEQIIERMEQLVEETSPGQGEKTPLDEGTDPIAQEHGDAVRSGAKNADE